VQGQYRPVRAGVSCAAVRSRVAKDASRHGRGLAFGLYLNRDAGISSGVVVQGQYRPVRAGVSCAAVRYGVAKDASRHGRGLAFGLGCTRIVTLAFYQGAWVQGQYRPVRAGVSCVAVRSGPHVPSTHRDKVADLHSGFI
jgi:hypothetical protein